MNRPLTESTHAHTVESNLAEAHVDELLERRRRLLARDVAAIGEAVRRKHSSDLDAAHCHQGLAEALRDRDVATELARRSHAHSHPEDVGRRTLSGPWYVVVLAGAILAEYWVDSSALFVLELPLSTTRALAWILTLSAVLYAHLVGKHARRAQGLAHARSTLGMEVLLARGLLAIGLLQALGVAIVRAQVGGSLVAGALFAVLGIGLFLALVTASFFFHNGQRDRRTAAQRAVMRRRVLVRRAEDRRQKRIARLRARTDKLQRDCGRIAAEADRVVAAAHQRYLHLHADTLPLPVAEPASLTAVRAIAAGNLPSWMTSPLIGPPVPSLAPPPPTGLPEAGHPVVPSSRATTR